jgi:hypothetical protein
MSRKLLKMVSKEIGKIRTYRHPWLTRQRISIIIQTCKQAHFGLIHHKFLLKLMWHLIHRVLDPWAESRQGSKVQPVLIPILEYQRKGRRSHSNRSRHMRRNSFSCRKLNWHRSRKFAESALGRKTKKKTRWYPLVNVLEQWVIFILNASENGSTPRDPKKKVNASRLIVGKPSSANFASNAFLVRSSPTAQS